MGILEKPLIKTAISSLCPTVTILTRGAFGRQAWSLHLRSSPLSSLENIVDVDVRGQAILPRLTQLRHNGHNSTQATINQYQLHRARDDAATLKPLPSPTVPSNFGPKCEFSIPSLSDVATRCVGPELTRFQRLKDEQIDFEITAIGRVLNEYDAARGQF